MAWTAEKTWNVGDVLTSSDMDTYVRDNSSFLYGDAAWTPLSLAANWQAFGSGFATPSWRRWGPNVQFRGIAQALAGATATIVSALPANALPAYNNLFSAESNTTPTTQPLEVTSAGVISCSTFSAGTTVSLDGVICSQLA